MRIKLNAIENLFTLEVKCVGVGWQKANAACNHKLLITDKDIRHKEIVSGNNKIVKSYGVICPLCGCFTKITSNKIPMRVKRNILQSERKKSLPN